MMETTLEVRWFVRGIPPAVVQHWFRFECIGELLTTEPEIREDWYLGRKSHNWEQFRAIAPYLTDSEAINFKMREGNLELKLRQQELGNQQFGNVNNSILWDGKIEQWCKIHEQNLSRRNNRFTPNSMSESSWISVGKERRQRLDRGVASELTWLRINNEDWWSVAFEMKVGNNIKILPTETTTVLNKNDQYNSFIEAINRASQTYYGPKLLAKNSYSYSRWLSKFQPQTSSNLDIKSNKV